MSQVTIKNTDPCKNEWVNLSAGWSLLHFTSYENHVVKGSIYSAYHDAKYTFTGLDQMLLIMDDIMNEADYPQSTFAPRVVYEEAFSMLDCVPPDSSEKNVSETYSEECMNSADIEKDSSEEEFIGEMNPVFKKSAAIRVYARQHASMQGEVIFSSGMAKKKVLFRSALELMRCMHEFLNA